MYSDSHGPFHPCFSSVRTLVESFQSVGNLGLKLQSNVIKSFFAKSVSELYTELLVFLESKDSLEQHSFLSVVLYCCHGNVGYIQISAVKDNISSCLVTSNLYLYNSIVFERCQIHS